MAKIYVADALVIHAAPQVVYAIVADYRNGHPQILPKETFTDLVVEAGGYGDGTVIRFRSHLGGVTRELHAQVTEQEKGQLLVENYTNAPMETSFRFTPVQEGQQTRVEIATAMESSRGLQGFVERWFVPIMLRRVYRKELVLLASVASKQSR